MPNISVTSVGKAYKQYPSRWVKMKEWFLPFSGKCHQLHWVLKEISFEVNSGEAVAIVGVNGAGKSTLLKMISGTIAATSGELSVSGRVSALLELGMGFHPDFSGRQNVFMAGQLLGLSLDEITTLMPEIEAFAEIGEYIDQPVRTYSSGMQVRLAFSIATANRPDVLIIDEALSVGDAYFQHKSFERIKAMRDMGTSLLIVSHDRVAIQSICDRALLLDKGYVIREGKPEDVMDFYHALMAEKDPSRIEQKVQSDNRIQTISGSREVHIVSVQLIAKQGDNVGVVNVGESVCLQVKVLAAEAVDRLALGFMIKDKFGQPIYGVNSHRMGEPIYDIKLGEEIAFNFTFEANLGQGNYSIAFSLSQTDSHIDKNYEWRDRGIVFQVVNVGKENFVGCTWLGANLSIDR